VKANNEGENQRMSFHDEDEIANDSLNPAVGEIVEATLSHRRLLLGGLGTAGLAFRRRPEPEDLNLAPEIGPALEVVWGPPAPDAP
jgi:hypothetical protein